MAYAYFTQYFFTYNNQACRIGMLNSANDPTTYNDGSRIQGSVSNAVGCRFYTKSGTTRTCYCIIFFENQTISNMPPRTYYQNDPGGYYMAFNTEGVYGSLTVSGVTYVYCQIKTHTYDEYTQKYYSVTSSPFDISTDFRSVNDVDYKEIGLVSAADDTARLQCLNSLLNEQPSSGGQGTATLTLKPPAQLLTFESLLYGKSIQKWVSGDCIIEFSTPEPEPATVDWEMAYEIVVGDSSAAVMVNSDWDTELVSINGFRPYLPGFEGQLMTIADGTSYSPFKQAGDISANFKLKAKSGSEVSMPSVYTRYDANDIIANTSIGSAFARVTIASKVRVTYNYEMCFVCRFNNTLKWWIIMPNGTLVPHTGSEISGYHITSAKLSTQYNNQVQISISSFTGQIKWYRLDEQRWLTRDSSTASTLVEFQCVVFLVSSTP